MQPVEPRESPLDPWIGDLAEVVDRIAQRCAGLSEAQRNWRPGPGAWSVAQVLEHLVIANESYVVPISEVLAGSARRSVWQRVPGLPRLCGAMLVAAFSPGASMRIQAPELWRPPDGVIDGGGVARLTAQGERLSDLMRRCRDRELTRIIIASPAAPFVVYHLLDAFRIIVLHLRHHAAQVDEIRRAAGFPAA